ncbi:MAG: hypothetical protein M3Z35_09065 [Nitrospirota bacterium]|nr:hypothetical protein [Nitrospirota bacterium]
MKQYIDESTHPKVMTAVSLLCITRAALIASFALAKVRRAPLRNATPALVLDPAIGAPEQLANQALLQGSNLLTQWWLRRMFIGRFSSSGSTMVRVSQRPRNSPIVEKSMLSALRAP